MIFKTSNPNRSEFSIISESGNVFYLPSTLTVREVEEILYALYGEHVNWNKTAEKNFSAEECKEFGYELSKYANYHPEKKLSETFNPDNLRVFAEEQFSEALWHDVQDAKDS